MVEWVPRSWGLTFRRLPTDIPFRWDHCPPAPFPGCRPAPDGPPEKRLEPLHIPLPSPSPSPGLAHLGLSLQMASCIPIPHPRPLGSSFGTPTPGWEGASIQGCSLQTTPSRMQHPVSSPFTWERETPLCPPHARPP